MKLSQLIEDLQDLLDDHGDLDVAVAHQPTYPLAARPSNVTVANLNGRRTAFVACAESLDYAPREAWDEYDPDAESFEDWHEAFVAAIGDRADELTEDDDDVARDFFDDGCEPEEAAEAFVEGLEMQP